MNLRFWHQSRQPLATGIEILTTSATEIENGLKSTIEVQQQDDQPILLQIMSLNRHQLHRSTNSPFPKQCVAPQPRLIRVEGLSGINASHCTGVVVGWLLLHQVAIIYVRPASYI